MKRILGTAVLMLLCGTLLFASKFDGKWKASAESDMGPLEFTVIFEVEGKAITGKMLTEYGDFEMKEGTISGDTFEMSVEIEWDVIKLSGKLVNDDKVVIKSKDGYGAETEVTLTRIKE